MNEALLDSDIFSEILKAKHPTVTRNAAAYRQQFGTLTLSVITVMEGVYGFQRTQNSRQLQNFLAAVAKEQLLEFDANAAELAGRIFGDLDRIGQTIGFADPMIAAIALTHHLDLVTGNTRHFQRIQQLGYPLSLMNWRV